MARPSSSRRTGRRARRGLALPLAMLFLASCGGGAPPAARTPESTAPSVSRPTTNGTAPVAGPGTERAPGPEGVFVDRAAEAGLTFRHDMGGVGEYYFPEVNGTGVALLDFDADGDLDVYFVQGGSFEPGAPGPPGGLFRSLLAEEGELRFEDVTATSGLQRVAYGQGVAAADYDNDGDMDLYLTNFGPNQLWRNEGQGTFRDVTAAAGVDDARWSSSASFLDYDRDGWLDLYVVNYTDFTVATNKPCHAANGARDYCGPLSYRPVPDRLFRNHGDGTFQDVTASSGISAAYGPGLGVVAADVDGDGWQDIYVANDAAANQLWMNRVGRRFDDSALVAGVAFNAQGDTEAGMGVVAEDPDEDGDWDLLLTHLTGEHNTHYVNDGRGLFEDRSMSTGYGAPSLPMTGFGLGSLDYDGDGWLDFLVANGAVKIEAMNVGAARPPPDDPLALYRQANLLYRNVGDGRLEDASTTGGPAFRQPRVGRGLAVGDVDNDGDPDAVLNNTQDRPTLLVNQVGSGAGWLGLRLLTEDGRRDALGAEITLTRSDGRVLRRRCHTDGSQVSARDPRVLFGLGGAGVERVAVRWPDGRAEEWSWSDWPTNAYVPIVQGRGPGAAP